VTPTLCRTWRGSESGHGATVLHPVIHMYVFNPTVPKSPNMTFSFRITGRPCIRVALDSSFGKSVLILTLKCVMYSLIYSVVDAGDIQLLD
jgi:hypothetical protein